MVQDEVTLLLLTSTIQCTRFQFLNKYINMASYKAEVNWQMMKYPRLRAFEAQMEHDASTRSWTINELYSYKEPAGFYIADDDSSHVLVMENQKEFQQECAESRALRIFGMSTCYGNKFPQLTKRSGRCLSKWGCEGVYSLRLEYGLVRVVDTEEGTDTTIDDNWKDHEKRNQNVFIRKWVAILEMRVEDSRGNHRTLVKSEIDAPTGAAALEALERKVERQPKYSYAFRPVLFSPTIYF
jgi:hypothetical protein